MTSPFTDRFGVLILVAAVAPNVATVLIALAAVGVASVLLMARLNATVQLAADPHMRGRVMALYLVAFLGTTPVGGPAVGWVAGNLGARWGLVVGAAACFAAAGIGAWSLARRPDLRR
jgi:MFS family permease